MDNNSIKIADIKSEISRSLKEEEDCRNYRKALEKLLAKYPKPTNNEQVETSKKK